MGPKPPSEEHPERPGDEAPGTSQPVDQNKRRFLSWAVRLPILAVGGAVSAALGRGKKPTEPGAVPEPAPGEKPAPKPLDLTGAPSAEAWEAGELSYNWIHSYMECFAMLNSGEVAFLDQNGRIIGEEFIPIPEEIIFHLKTLDLGAIPGDLLATERSEILRILSVAEIPRELNKKQIEKLKDWIFQPWLTKMRKELQTRYPTIYLNINQDEPTLVNIRTIFAGKKIEADKSYIDVVWANAQKSVSEKNKKSRYKFMKERLAASGLPQELQMIALGLIGIESKYINMEENSSGAAGAFQIMRDEAREAHPPLMGFHHKEKIIMVGRGRRKKPKKIVKDVPFDDRLDFEKASKRFMELYEGRYKLVKNHPYVKELQKRFRLTEKDIVYPLILNTYHSGIGCNIMGYTDKKNGKRYVGLCRWFLDNFPTKESVEAILGKGPYGEDIFNLMVTLFAQNAVDPSFKKASRSYYRRSRAMAELLQMKEEEEANPRDMSKVVEFTADDDRPYVPPAKPKKREAEVVAVKPQPVHPENENGPAVIDGTRAKVALIAGVGAHLVGEELRNQEPTDRRTHLQRLGRAVGTLLASAGAVALGSSLSSAGIEERRPPVRRKKEIDVPYKFIPELDEAPVRAALQNELMKAGGVAPLAKPEEITPLDISTIFEELKSPLILGLKAALENNLEPFNKTGEIKRGKNVVAVPLESPLVRLRGVGIADDGKIRDEEPIAKQNDTDFAYLRDFTFTTMQEIALELNRKLLTEYGMPDRFRIRLVATSLSRSKEFHKKVQKKHKRYAAKGDTPHMFGHTFDLSRFRYDIIDTKTNKYCRINVGSAPGSVENTFSLVRTVNAVLGRILIEMKHRETGEILVIHEDNNPVYHITAVPPKML